MFASKTTKDVELQDDNGNPIVATLRKLSGVHLDKARKVATTTMTAAARDLGGDLIKAFREAATEKDQANAVAVAPKKEPTREEKDKAVFASYDRTTTLQLGVVSLGGDDKRLPEDLLDLDEDTSETLFKALIRLSTPAAFVDEAPASKD